MKVGKLYEVIRGPVVSEKSAQVGEKHNQYVFRVSKDASKPEIKEAVEKLFGVKVKGVQTLNYQGKEKRFGRFIGRRSSWKKAYVSLEAGEEITVFSEL